MHKTLCLAVAVLFPFAAFAQRPSGPASDAPPPAIATRTANMTNMPGFLPLHWDANAGKLYLEVPLNAQGKSFGYSVDELAAVRDRFERSGA